MHQEYQYLNVLSDILENGKKHKNRTGVDTYRLLCKTMEFDLTNEFPLLTTKKVYWKGVAVELLWFLSGSTNIQYLQENNVKIWDANAEDFYEKQRQEWQRAKNNGVHLPPPTEGELGPVYGFQWRNFNGIPSSQNKVGFDQISWAIDQIKNNPSSRRIIVSAWNPLQIPFMALPPCHVLFQFTVDEEEGLLNCTLYQRSCDMFLGVPFNIASYALLTCLMAHTCGLKPGKFFHVLNDAHIYENHIDQVQEQLSREPRKLPTLEVNKDVKDIFEIKYEDLLLKDYDPYPAIKAEMAV